MAKAKFRMRDSDPGFKKAIAKMGKGSSVTQIGIFSKDSGSDLVKYASVNEFGTNNAGKGNNTVIPERSFLRATIDANRKKIIAIIDKGKVALVAGKISQKDILEEIGLFVEGKVKERISRGIKPENAPSTIRQKGSSTPLIDSGRLRQSIIHIVKSEGLF